MSSERTQHAESTERKIGAFDVMKRMADTNNHALKLAPLSNVLSARKVKAGTQVTIGVGDDDLCGKILHGQLCGGLIFCDKEEFERVEAEMRNENAE